MARGRRDEEEETEANLKDPVFRIRALTLAVLIEPARRLTSFFMHESGIDLSSQREDWPPIVNLLNRKSSLLHACLQYWSTLLAEPDRCPRLVLLWQQRKCTSFREWSARHPEDIQYLRKGALVLIAAVERRLSQYMSSKFSVISICDARMPRGQRMRLAEELLAKNPCCLPEGVQRSLAARARKGLGPTATIADGAAAFLSMAPVLFVVAWFVRLSVACIERMHAMHRRVASDAQSAYHSLAARSVCTRVRQAWERREADAKKNMTAPKRGKPDGVDFSQLKRGLSPFEVFKKRLMAEEAAEGIRRNPASKETLAYYKDAWPRVDTAEDAVCDEISESTKAAAKQRRLVANSSQAALLPPRLHQCLHQSKVALLRQEVIAPTLCRCQSSMLGAPKWLWPSSLTWAKQCKSMACSTPVA